jgi:hypothetical protein
MEPKDYSATSKKWQKLGRIASFFAQTVSTGE